MSTPSSSPLKISREIDSKIQDLVKDLPEPTSQQNISLLVEAVSSAFKYSEDSLSQDPDLLALLDKAPSDFTPIDLPPSEPFEEWSSIVEREAQANMPQSSAAGLKDRSSLGKVTPKLPLTKSTIPSSVSKTTSTPSGSTQTSQVSYGTALSGSSGQTSEIEVPCGLSWDTLSSEIPALYASLATEIDLFIEDGKFVNPFTKAINKQDLYEIMAERGVTFNLLPALYKLFNSCSQLTEHEVVRRIATLESTFQALCFFQGLTLFGPLVYDEISETMRLERGAYQGRQEAALTSITNLLSGLTQSLGSFNNTFGEVRADMASITQEQKRLIADLQAPPSHTTRYQVPEDQLDHFIVPFKPEEITIVVDPEEEHGFHIYGPEVTAYERDYMILAKELRAGSATYSAMVQLRRPDLIMAELLKTCCSCLSSGFLAANRN